MAAMNPGGEPGARRSRCTRAARAIERLGEGKPGALGMFALRRHVKGCAACETSFIRMVALLDALNDTVRVGAPEGFSEELLARLAAGREPAHENHERAAGRKGLLWVAGAAVLGIGVAVGVAVGMKFRGHLPREVDADEGFAVGQAAV